jgi:hypothetical protein
MSDYTHYAKINTQALHDLAVLNEQYKQRIAELEAALEPFALCILEKGLEDDIVVADVDGNYDMTEYGKLEYSYLLTAGEFRNATKALGKGNENL